MQINAIQRLLLFVASVWCSGVFGLIDMNMITDKVATADETQIRQTLGQLETYEPMLIGMLTNVNTKDELRAKITETEGLIAALETKQAELVTEPTAEQTAQIEALRAKKTELTAFKQKVDDPSTTIAQLKPEWEQKVSTTITEIKALDVKKHEQVEKAAVTARMVMFHSIVLPIMLVG